MKEQTMANAQDKARGDLEQARARVTEWDRALEQAKTARDRAEDSAPDDPSVLEGFADEYARAEGRVRAAAKGRQQAEAAVLAALEAVVRAGLDDARADVKAAEQAHAAHRKKLDTLLAKVSELDGADYRPTVLEDYGTPEVGVTYSVKVSKAAELLGRVRSAEASVSLHESVLDRGTLPAVPGAEVPPTLREYVDALRAAGALSPAEARRAAAVELEQAEAEQEAAKAAERPHGWRTRARLAGAR